VDVEEGEQPVSDPRFERLITEGFQFTSRSIRGATLRASYGSGYAEGAVIGKSLMGWRVKIAALPDVEGEYLVNAGEFGLQTRAAYLWDFFVRHNVDNARKPFWLRDPVSKRDYLAELDLDEIEFEMFCLTVFSTGLPLRQRRVAGVESPSDPVEMENNQEI
jgi:hypothetical protein